MAKIVWMSDSPTITTGYGRVSKELCNAFHNEGHEVICIGWGHQDSQPNPFPFRLVACDSYNDNFGEDILANLIRNEKPDILFTLGDPWMTEYIPEMEERKTVAWVSYFPIDGYPVPLNWHRWMQNADIPVVFSKFSFDLVKDIIGRNPIFIPHGVDTDTFKPLSDTQAIKKQILGFDDKFVVGTVARNQPRKNLPALIKAFAKFVKNKDDAVLYMHTQIRDVGWNIDELVNRFDIQDKVYSTNQFNALSGMKDYQLNEIYNTFDLFALPTMAEGFGLPILEAQSCGVPVLVTDFSACSELVVDRSELIKVKDTLIMGRGIEQAIADTDDLAQKLGYFYNDWKKKNSVKKHALGKQGREKAESMSWSKINSEFINLIKIIEPQAKEIDKTIKPSFFVM